MENKLNTSFVQKIQRGVEPDIKPGETAIEYLKRTEAKRVSEMIMAAEPLKRPEAYNLDPQHDIKPGLSPAAPAPKEVVFIEGYKLSRDFLTCVAVCMMKNSETSQILNAFGFDIKDLNGKPVVFTKPKKKIKSKKKK